MVEFEKKMSRTPKPKIDLFSYFKVASKASDGDTSIEVDEQRPSIEIDEQRPSIEIDEHPSSEFVEQRASKFQRVESQGVDVIGVSSSIQRDPGLRLPIWKHPVTQQDEVRRAYIKAGPYQPLLLEYPATEVGKQKRRFQYSWFTKFSCFLF
jgi:hypothetical protein